MSESTVIQPAAGQAILTTDTGHRDHHGHGHGHGYNHYDRNDWERTILREQAAGFRSAAADRVGLGSEIQETATAAALAACKLGDGIAEASKEAAVASKDQLVTAYQVEGRQAVQAERLAAASTLQAEKIAAAAQLAVEKVSSAALLDSTKNAAAIAAQLAACCCELKEKITSDGDMTRSLINNNEVQRLRDQVTALQRFVPVTVPVPL